MKAEQPTQEQLETLRRDAPFNSFLRRAAEVERQKILQTVPTHTNWAGGSLSTEGSMRERSMRSTSTNHRRSQEGYMPTILDKDQVGRSLRNDDDDDDEEFRSLAETSRSR